MKYKPVDGHYCLADKNHSECGRVYRGILLCKKPFNPERLKEIMEFWNNLIPGLFVKNQAAPPRLIAKVPSP